MLRPVRKTRTTSADWTPACQPRLPPLMSMKTGSLQPPAPVLTRRTPLPWRPPMTSPARMTSGMYGDRRASLEKALGDALVRLLHHLLEDADGVLDLLDLLFAGAFGSRPGAAAGAAASEAKSAAIKTATAVALTGPAFLIASLIAVLLDMVSVDLSGRRPLSASRPPPSRRRRRGWPRRRRCRPPRPGRSRARWPR
jgi:hypothetical protein